MYSLDVLHKIIKERLEMNIFSVFVTSFLCYIYHVYLFIVNVKSIESCMNNYVM
jgi:hypothetical protein